MGKKVDCVKAEEFSEVIYRRKQFEYAHSMFDCKHLPYKHSSKWLLLSLVPEKLQFSMKGKNATEKLNAVANSNYAQIRIPSEETVT